MIEIKEYLKDLLGHGPNLTALQMSIRALLVSAICLLLIRFAGRRSFGIGTALDNMIAVLLGAILSRAVVGASPFISTVAAAATVAGFHRLGGWLGLYSHFFGKLVKGETKVLYEKGNFNKRNMRRNLITQRDVMEGVRLCGNVDSLEKVESVYLERNGKISVIKKEEKL